MQWAMHAKCPRRALHALVSFSSLSHNSWGWTPAHVSLWAFCQIKGLDVIVFGCWWREGYKRRAKSTFECWGRRPMALLCGWCPVNRVQGNIGWPDGVGRPSESTIHTPLHLYLGLKSSYKLKIRKSAEPIVQKCYKIIRNLLRLPWIFLFNISIPSYQKEKNFYIVFIFISVLWDCNIQVSICLQCLKLQFINVL